MTAVATRLGLLSAWLNAASASYRLPSGTAVYVSRYGSLVPQRLDRMPASIFHETALPLYVSADEADGVSIAPPDLAECINSPSLFDRINHLMFIGEDGREIPPVAWYPLTDPAEPLAAVLARYGATLRDDMPTVFLPLYGALGPRDRSFLARRLPFISPYAIDPPKAIPSPRYTPPPDAAIRWKWPT